MALDRAQVRDWLCRTEFPSARVTYKAEKVTDDFVVFCATTSTARVMVPLEVVVEWLEAYEKRRFRASTSPREMRDIVKKESNWAKQMHSFETHLAAVVRSWSKK